MSITSAPVSPEFFSLAQARLYTGLSDNTLRRRIASVALPAYDLSDPASPQRTLRVRRSDLDALARPIRGAA
nr:hypothetical protein [Propionicimonas sp.]